MSPSLTIHILSLFPDYFLSPFNESIIKRAQQKGILTINLIDIRDFAEGKHCQVDDRTYGGGPGMVLMPDPVVKAIKSVRTPKSKVIYLSPQGPLLKASKCRELSQSTDLILLCGHYEGIDERVMKYVDEEISIGDYVLTNGCLSAIVLVDAVVRFVPNVIGHEDATKEDSFENGLFDCPHYTRPQVFEDESVPEVLLNGNHKKIASWRTEKALEKTKRVRLDLYKEFMKKKDIIH